MKVIDQFPEESCDSIPKRVLLPRQVCRTMAKTYEGLATLARETADATAAAAVTWR